MKLYLIVIAAQNMSSNGIDKVPLFFRSLRDKYEIDLQTTIDNEQLHKTKLSQTKDKLEKTEIQLQQTENKLQEYVSELNNANEVKYFKEQLVIISYKEQLSIKNYIMNDK